MLTAAHLRQILDYDPTTGVFTWKIDCGGRRRIGKRAGCPTDKGYRAIKIDGRLYLEHRLAWLYVHGVWPPGHMDHRNLVRADNAIAELRPASRSQNGANRSLYSNNTSGFKGVIFHKQKQKWRARITVNGHKKSLGLYATPQDAHAAYAAAAQQHFGAFARP